MRFLLLVLLLGFVAYVFRRRLKPAMYIVAAGYIGITVVRLIQWHGEGDDRWLGVISDLAIFGVAWLMVWTGVKVVESWRARIKGRRQRDGSEERVQRLR